MTEAKKLYDATARSYDKRHNNPTTKYMRRKETGLIKKYARGLVLDVGCGTGEHLNLFENSIGLDISYNMLKEVRKKPSAPLIQAKAEELPIKDAGLDAVLCMFTTLNLCDFNAAANEISRVLNKGGIAIVSVASVWDRYDKPLIERLKGAESKRKGVRIEGFRLNFHLFSKKGFIDLFKENGFELVEFHGIFKLQKPYWGWHRDFTPVEKLKLEIFDHLLPSKTGRMYFGVFKKIEDI